MKNFRSLVFVELTRIKVEFFELWDYHPTIVPTCGVSWWRIEFYKQDIQHLSERTSQQLFFSLTLNLNPWFFPPILHVLVSATQGIMLFVSHPTKRASMSQDFLEWVAQNARWLQKSKRGTSGAGQ